MYIFTGLLADIANLIGEDKALLLCKVKGGTSLYVPTERYLDEEHLLTRLLGEKARMFCRVYGGDQIKIPLGPEYGNMAAQRKKIREGILAGKSASIIAREAGVTVRTIEKHRQRMRLYKRQGSLLDI